MACFFMFIRFFSKYTRSVEKFFLFLDLKQFFD